MITLFDERDLVSFGMYMISDARKKSIEDNSEITNEEVRKQILKTVTQFDFNNWLALKMKSEQEEQEQVSSDSPENIVVEESEEDEEDHPKVIKMTPKI